MRPGHARALHSRGSLSSTSTKTDLQSISIHHKAGPVLLSLQLEGCNARFSLIARRMAAYGCKLRKACPQSFSKQDQLACRRGPLKLLQGSQFQNNIGNRNSSKVPVQRHLQHVQGSGIKKNIVGSQPAPHEVGIKEVKVLGARPVFDAAAASDKCYALPPPRMTPIKEVHAMMEPTLNLLLNSSTTGRS